jgi:hypothetical protein
VTASVTPTEQESTPEDTPVAGPTPEMPEKLPKTGAGGGDRIPTEALVSLVLFGGWIARRWAVRTERV